MVQPEVLEALAQGGSALNLRRRLAAKAFAHTARYDGRVANWLGARVHGGSTEPFAPSLHLSFERKQLLRYGENPHQSGALYVESNAPAGTIARSELLAGKELSFNNIADADAALECVKAFQRTPACVIVKHANPCGVALAAAPARRMNWPTRVIRFPHSAASSPSTIVWTNPPLRPSSSASLSKS